MTNEVRQDFTFIHPEYFLNAKYSTEKGSVHLNNSENEQTYKALIITGCKVISLKTLQKIKDYYDKGGLVISTGKLPFKSSEMGQDEKVKALILEIFGVNPESQLISEINTKENKNGGKAISISNPAKSSLEKAIRSRVTPDVKFSPNPYLSKDLGKFSYIHKIKDGKDIYFFSNSTDQPIRTEVTLKGSFDLYSANPHNGTITPLENTAQVTVGNQEFTKANLNLNPVSATFWISK